MISGEKSMAEETVNGNGSQPEGEGISVKYKVILKEIERIENPRTGMAYKLLVLVISVGLFIQMQVITGSVSGLAAILIVLFIHETGHLAAMKLSGYSNVQMFFIPFFGAAVSGREMKPGPVKKAVVSLMGPLPGIVLGFPALVISARTGIRQFREYGNISLVINMLNLLPFYPLDGGQLFDAILFSRRPEAGHRFQDHRRAGTGPACRRWVGGHRYFRGAGADHRTFRGGHGEHSEGPEEGRV